MLKKNQAAHTIDWLLKCNTDLKHETSIVAFKLLRKLSWATSTQVYSEYFFQA